MAKIYYCASRDDKLYDHLHDEFKNVKNNINKFDLNKNKCSDTFDNVNKILSKRYEHNNDSILILKGVQKQMNFIKINCLNTEKINENNEVTFNKQLLL